MKKIIGIACVAACAALAGCKSVPTTDHMYTATYAIGASTGLVANETKIDDASRNAIVDIVNDVRNCVPETNQTFEAAWTPIAQAHVDKLVADGKIDAAQGKIIMTAFSLIVKGTDYVFEVRYPKAKQYKDLVVSAVDGFSDGFLMVFKPVDSAAKAQRSAREYDAEAYYWLKRNRY